MTRSFLAGVVFLLATIALPASAGNRHHHGNDDYNGYGYRFVYADGNGYGYDNRFENGYVGGYGYGRHYTAYSHIDRYHRVRNHQRTCRQHRDVHHELRDLHGDAHDQGFYDREDHGDTHEALDDGHDQWHSDQLGADYCSD